MKKYLLILLVLTISCKTTIITSDDDYEESPKKAIPRQEVKPGNTIFYFIRHVDTENVDSNDPNISLKGKNRVKKLITYFTNKRLDSVLSTNFNRTIQTAKPIALSKNIIGDFYNPLKINATDWIKKNKGKAILFVGHSNTTPSLANKFIGKMEYTQMMDDNYSDIYRVIISGDTIYNDVLDLETEISTIQLAQKKN